MAIDPIDDLKGRAIAPTSLGPIKPTPEILADIAASTANLSAVAKSVSDRLTLQADAGDIFAVMELDAREHARDASA